MRADSPSRTALLVAGGVVMAEADARLRGISPPRAAELSRQLLMASPEGRRLLRRIDSGVGRAWLRLLERCTIPGIVAHWVCRKRWIDDAWRHARADGFDTLIVLGSGLDTLSLRVASEEGGRVRAFDVDHPATLAARRAGLASMGGATDRALVEHDLAKPGLHAALAEGLPGDASAVVVIEGVLMYLEPEHVIELFAELGRLSVARLRVVFTFMELSRKGKPAFEPRSRLVDLWLRWRGEPFRGGLAFDSLPAWLEQRGFMLGLSSRTPGHELAAGGLPRGECAAVADAVRPGIRPPAGE